MSLHRQDTPLSERCPIRDVLDRLGDRWTVLVLDTLDQGTRRFNELQRAIEDISPRMLAQTLRQLEQDGLVSREVFATVPPRVDYSLTGLGRSFFDRFKPMIAWAVENQSAVRAARAEYAGRQASAG